LSTSVKLQWKSVPLSDRSLLYNILIQSDIERTKNVNTGFGIAIMNAEIDKLLPNREYTIKIRAVNVVGSGVYSKPFTFKTKRMGMLNY
jgi:Fibronectin type III domain.